MASSTLEIDRPPSTVILCSNQSSAGTVAYWLKKLGVSAATASSGYQARDLLQGTAARLLITDRALPPWPGLDTLAALKQEFSSLKIAVLDDGVPESRALARSAGADIILARPLRKSNLIEACIAAAVPGSGIECAR